MSGASGGDRLLLLHRFYDFGIIHNISLSYIHKPWNNENENAFKIEIYYIIVIQLSVIRSHSIFWKYVLLLSVSELEKNWRDAMHYIFEIGFGKYRDIFEIKTLILRNLNWWDIEYNNNK